MTKVKVLSTDDDNNNNNNDDDDAGAMTIVLRQTKNYSPSGMLIIMIKPQTVCSLSNNFAGKSINIVFKRTK